MTDPKKKSGFTRREFMEVTGAATLALGAGVGCAPDDGIPASRVAVAGLADIEASVLRAIELAGGLGFIGAGETVFIKPNSVHPASDGADGIVTGTAVLAAVVRAVRAQSSTAKIIVGDRSFRVFETSDVMRDTGQDRAAYEAGADEIYAAPRPSVEPDAWVTLQPPHWDETWAEEGGILAMRKLVEADHIINLPVAKNHRWAAFSLGLKNYIGGVGDESRMPIHYVMDDPARISRDICILNGMFNHTRMTIIDAQHCMVNGGPEGVLEDAVFTSPGLVLASADRVAIDLVGAALLGHELTGAEVPDPDPMHDILTETAAWELPQIVEGRALGLGLQDLSSFDIATDGVDAAVFDALKSRTAMPA